MRIGDPAGRAEHQHMAAGVARAPHADPRCIDFRLRFQKRDRPPPIGDLAPGIDVVSNGPIARAVIAMVMDKRDKTGLGECAGEALEPMLLDPRITMRDDMADSGPARFDGKNSQPRRRSPPSTPNSTSRRSTMVFPSEARACSARAESAGFSRRSG